MPASMSLERRVLLKALGAKVVLTLAEKGTFTQFICSLEITIYICFIEKLFLTYFKYNRNEWSSSQSRVDCCGLYKIIIPIICKLLINISINCLYIKSTPGSYMLQQFNNPDNPKVHRFSLDKNLYIFICNIYISKIFIQISYFFYTERQLVQRFGIKLMELLMY